MDNDEEPKDAPRVDEKTTETAPVDWYQRIQNFEQERITRRKALSKLGITFGQLSAALFLSDHVAHALGSPLKDRRVQALGRNLTEENLRIGIPVGVNPNSSSGSSASGSSQSSSGSPSSSSSSSNSSSGSSKSSSSSSSDSFYGDSFTTAGPGSGWASYTASGTGGIGSGKGGATSSGSSSSYGGTLDPNSSDSGSSVGGNSNSSSGSSDYVNSSSGSSVSDQGGTGGSSGSSGSQGGTSSSSSGSSYSSAMPTVYVTGLSPIDLSDPLAGLIYVGDQLDSNSPVASASVQNPPPNASKSTWTWALQNAWYSTTNLSVDGGLFLGTLPSVTSSDGSVTGSTAVLNGDFDPAGYYWIEAVATVTFRDSVNNVITLGIDPNNNPIISVSNAPGQSDGIDYLGS